MVVDLYGILVRLRCLETGTRQLDRDGRAGRKNPGTLWLTDVRDGRRAATADLSFNSGQRSDLVVPVTGLPAAQRQLAAGRDRLDGDDCHGRRPDAAVRFVGSLRGLEAAGQRCQTYPSLTSRCNRFYIVATRLQAGLPAVRSDLGKGPGAQHDDVKLLNELL